MELIGQRFFHVDSLGRGEKPDLSNFCCCSVCGLCPSAANHSAHCPLGGAPYFNAEHLGKEQLPRFSRLHNPLSVSVAKAAAAEAKARVAGIPADQLGYKWGICPGIGGKEGLVELLAIDRWISPSGNYSTGGDEPDTPNSLSSVIYHLQKHQDREQLQQQQFTPGPPVRPLTPAQQQPQQLMHPIVQQQQQQPLPPAPQPMLQPFVPAPPATQLQCFRSSVQRQQQQQLYTPPSPPRPQHQPVDFAKLADMAAALHREGQHHCQEIEAHQRALQKCLQVAQLGNQFVADAQQYLQQHHQPPLPATRPDAFAASQPYAAPHHIIRHC